MGHSTDRSAIMFPSVAFSTCSGGFPGRRPTTRGDWVHLPRPAPERADLAPAHRAGLITSSSGSTVNARVDEGRLRWQSHGVHHRGRVGAGLANLANFSTGNTSTTFSAERRWQRDLLRARQGDESVGHQQRVERGGADGRRRACTAAPPPPAGFTLTGNSGGTVSFAWGPSPSATTYIIEAGSVPGSSNLANSDLNSSATTATFAGVGRGTYFVRLRARNNCGTSGVSNEVTLVVP